MSNYSHVSDEEESMIRRRHTEDKGISPYSSIGRLDRERAIDADLRQLEHERIVESNRKLWPEDKFW